MDGADDADDKHEILPSTELDGAADTIVKDENVEDSNITEAQWSALKRFIQDLIEYRSDEYVVFFSYKIPKQ